MAQVFDTRLREGRLAALPRRGSVLGSREGDVVVWCEDNGYCPECLGRWPRAGWRPFTDIRCSRCGLKEDLMFKGGEWLCLYDRTHAPRAAFRAPA
jgi:hypothetical protein